MGFVFCLHVFELGLVCEFLHVSFLTQGICPCLRGWPMLLCFVMFLTYWSYGQLKPSLPSAHSTGRGFCFVCEVPWGGVDDFSIC